MSDLLVIGTAQPPDSLRQRLEREVAACAPLATACGLQPPQMSEHKRGNWFFLAVQWPAPPGRGRGGRPRPAGRGGAVGIGPATAVDADPPGVPWDGLALTDRRRPDYPGAAGSTGRLAAELRYDFGGLLLGGTGWLPGAVASPGRGTAARRPGAAGRPVPGRQDKGTTPGLGAGATVPNGMEGDCEPAGGGLAGRPDGAARGIPDRHGTATDPSQQVPEPDTGGTGGGRATSAGRSAQPGHGRGAVSTGPADETEPLLRDWQARVVRALVSYIHDEHRWHLMQRLVTRRYAHLTPDERRQALAYARRHLAATPARDAQLRHQLGRQVAAYVEGAGLLLVDGFLRFRCRDYVEALEVAVDRAVDEYLLDREYRDFVQLLRQFVDLQAPRLDVVHVVVEPSGAFTMTDGQGRAVPLPPGEGWVTGPGDAVAPDPGDALLSALVTVAARRFVVHLRRHNQGLAGDTRDMLEQVFGSRVELCPGCTRCRSRQRRRVAPAPSAR